MVKYFNIIRKHQKLICGLIMSLFSVVLIASCGVKFEKRRYNKGFHVSINTKKNFKNISKKIERENYISENKTLFLKTGGTQDSNAVNVFNSHGFATKDALTSSSTVGLSKERKSNIAPETLNLYGFKRTPSTINHKKEHEEVTSKVIKAHSYGQRNKKTDEEKAKIFERGSKRFFWLFFALLTLTLVASLLLMEYFILPFIGGAIILLVPTTLHSVYSSLIVKYTENSELKRKSRLKFWLLLGIYSLILIALALVIILVFV